MCNPCLLLGFTCSYAKTLKWQETEVVELPKVLNAPCRADVRVQSWMFLNATLEDFAPHIIFSTTDVDSDDSGDGVSSDESIHHPNTSLYPFPLSENADLTLWPFGEDESLEYLQPWISPLAISSEQLRLWSYFNEAIAPTCVLNPNLNPYQDVILRIAASKGTASPLFNGIMAISASQLYILGDTRFQSLYWDYRDRVLRSLRLETAKVGHERMARDPSSAAHILATVMILMFLDVSINL